MQRHLRQPGGRRALPARRRALRGGVLPPPGSALRGRAAGPLVDGAGGGLVTERGRRPRRARAAPCSSAVPTRSRDEDGDRAPGRPVPSSPCAPAASPPASPGATAPTRPSRRPADDRVTSDSDQPPRPRPSTSVACEIAFDQRVLRPRAWTDSQSCGRQRCCRRCRRGRPRAVLGSRPDRPAGRRRVRTRRLVCVDVNPVAAEYIAAQRRGGRAAGPGRDPAG